MPKKAKSDKTKKKISAKKAKKDMVGPRDTATQVFSGLLGHIPIDETDLKLIQLLQKNARMTNIELAEKLKTSEATVRRRTNNLVERGYIRAFSALLDFNRIGNPVKANIVANVRKDRLEHIAESLTQYENVHMVCQTMGNHNLFCETYFNNISEFQDFTEKVLQEESVENYECYIVTKSYKPCPWSGI
jgi:DNA-binding Lrp family transcriptional regulator